MITDIYKPNGAWKVEQNGTYAVDDDNKRVYIEYAHPDSVDCLMSEVIQYINLAQNRKLTTKTASEVYATIHSGIAHIHPFWDGNGRLARLLANLPVLHAGLPPIMIDQKTEKNISNCCQTIKEQLVSWTKNWCLARKEQLQSFAEFCKNPIV